MFQDQLSLPTTKIPIELPTSSALPQPSRPPQWAGHTFAQVLRFHRKRLGLTQRELAQQIGATESLLRKLESGERRPSTQVAALLARRLVPAAEREPFVALARSTPNPSDAAHAAAAHLPTPPTPLIGREPACNFILRKLKSASVRLLTLVGAGGVGKTRLAIEAAHRLAPQFSHGARWVEFAALRRDDDIAPAILNALQLHPSPSQPAGEQLVETLRSQHMLLVLDNCEHLEGLPAQIATLLAQCPHLKLLVTSRRRLHVRAEHLLEVLPLPFAAEHAAEAEFENVETIEVVEAGDVRTVAVAPAVALFIQRAQAVNPGLSLDAATLQTVVRVCQRLEGLPLAIELAATRAHVMTLAELWASLQRSPRLALVGHGAADLPERQKSLANTLTWSYALLTPTQQTVFCALSVCVAGFTLATAQAMLGKVLGQAGEAVVEGWVFALADAHLIQRMPARPPADSISRWRMLEVVREFGEVQLQAAGTLETTRTTYTNHLLQWAEVAEEFICLTRPMTNGIQKARETLEVGFVMDPATSLTRGVADKVCYSPRKF